MVKRTYGLPNRFKGYLENKPKYVDWKVVAGGKISSIQTYDVVFDDYDLKIRQIGMK